MFAAWRARLDARESHWLARLSEYEEVWKGRLADSVTSWAVDDSAKDYKWQHAASVLRRQYEDREVTLTHEFHKTLRQLSDEQKKQLDDVIQQYTCVRSFAILLLVHANGSGVVLQSKREFTESAA